VRPVLATPQIDQQPEETDPKQGETSDGNWHVLEWLRVAISLISVCIKVRCVVLPAWNTAACCDSGLHRLAAKGIVPYVGICIFARFFLCPPQFLLCMV
jgi:hypothetical protein